MYEGYGEGEVIRRGPSGVGAYPDDPERDHVAFGNRPRAACCRKLGAQLQVTRRRYRRRHCVGLRKALLIQRLDCSLCNLFDIRSQQKHSMWASICDSTVEHRINGEQSVKGLFKRNLP